ncbi:MAG: PilW family protein [Candidatus Binatia bacterium]
MDRKQFKVQSSTLPVARRTSHAGFTMVELLISILLTSIIMGAVYSVFRVQTHSVKAQESRLEAQEYARAVLDMVVREVRNAGYFPVGACATPANTNGIVAASTQSFHFVYDADAANGCADADEDIEYWFDTTGCPTGFGNIMRKTIVPANDQAMTDCNVPTGTANFSFTYYAQNSSTPMSTIDLATIQRVEVSLTVQSKNPDADFGGGQLDAIMTSNANLRNRGLPP